MTIQGYRRRRARRWPPGQAVSRLAAGSARQPLGRVQWVDALEPRDARSGETMAATS
jgi:hypothetical protein